MVMRAFTGVFYGHLALASICVDLFSLQDYLSSKIMCHPEKLNGYFSSLSTVEMITK